MDPEEFAEFLTAVRAGDQAAAEQLVRRYEPYLRRVIRLRLRNPRLRRLFDSMDICQSILGGFFARAHQGQFELTTPEQLTALLSRMAINKVIAKTRAIGKDGGVPPPDWDPIDPDPSPAEQADQRDLLDEARRLLTGKELRLFELHLVQGLTFPAIAAADGGTPDALRIRLARALARVRRTLSEEANGVP